MKKIREYIKSNPFVLILAYWPIHGLWYLILQETTMNRNPVAIYNSLDSAIPFCEWFILPYVLWYPFIIAVSLYMLMKNKEGFVRLYTFMFGGMFVCMLVCTVFPMYFDRSNIVMYQNDNFLTDAVKFLQGFDAPTTILPSMHVYVSCGLYFSVMKDKMLSKGLKAASLALTVGICLATVLIKQHSVYDVAAALVLCIPMYVFAFKSSFP